MTGREHGTAGEPASAADRPPHAADVEQPTAELTAELAAELAAVRDELRRSKQQHDMFAGQVSHDLRNPLTSISMSLQMLQEQPSVTGDEDAVWMVGRALAGVEQMNGLIEKLLDPATPGGPEQQPPHQPDSARKPGI